MSREIGFTDSTLLFALAACAATACAADEGTRAGPIVRDSAGVTIVENGSAAWGAGAEWTVAEEPLLEIGLVDGPREYQLYRASSAARLSDGRLVVANGGTDELRFYDEAGQHLLSVGRTGGGPGEFEDLQRVWALPGDSLLAYDFMPSRLSTFSSSGEFVRSVHIAAPDGRQVLVRGPAGDGSVIAMGAPIWDAPGSEPGIVRDSVPYYRYDAEGSLAATLGLFPSVEVLRVARGDGWTLISPPFPRAPVTTTARDRFYFGPAEAYELRVYTLAGELERVIRLPHERRPVTSEDIAAFRRHRLEATGEGMRPAMERWLNEMPYPETMPPYERIQVDANENIWVADYKATPDEERPWKVFSPDGRYLGEVAMPIGLEVTQIGPDFVLGRWLDDFEVEHIRVHALTR